MNAPLLRYEMEQRNISAQELCDQLQITIGTFYKKMRGETEFKLSEITKIVEVLHLESPVPIFFAEKSS